tara:strand:- start:830 stop:1660 length:831 start_codon:yes stop_codon:yes gene_type:complete
MALWNETTKPKWLLGVDSTGKGLGNNGIVNTTPEPDVVGNELGTVVEDPAIGWKQWHSKEASWNGTPGDGRGWYEILATQDINGAPTLAITDIVVAEGLISNVTLIGSDVNGDPLTYTKTAGIGNGTITGDVFTYDASDEDADAADQAFTVKVADDRGLSADVTFTVSVNAAPTLSAANGSYTLGAATLNVTLDGTAGTVGSPITYTAGTPAVTQAEAVESLVAPTIGTVTFDGQTMTVPISEDGTLASDDTIVISVTATDAEGLVVSADVTITVV